MGNFIQRIIKRLMYYSVYLHFRSMHGLLIGFLDISVMTMHQSLVALTNDYNKMEGPMAIQVYSHGKLQPKK